MALAAAVLGISCGCAEPQAEPSLLSPLVRADEDVLHVPHGDSIDATLAVRNTGARALAFRARSTTCGCLTIRSKETRSLGPGEIGNVELLVDGENPGVKMEKVQLLIETDSGAPFVEEIPVQIWTGSRLFVGKKQIAFSGTAGSRLPSALIVADVMVEGGEPPRLDWQATGGLDFELEDVSVVREGALSIARYELAVKLPADRVGLRSEKVSFSHEGKDTLVMNASVLTR